MGAAQERGAASPPGATDEPVEVEVKFGVTDPGAIRDLILAADPAALAGFTAASEPRSIVVVDRYLDTDLDTGALFGRLVRARVRELDGEHTLTVKRAGSLVGFVTTRVELEGPATASLDPLDWPPSDARSLLFAASAGMPLVEIATLRQARLVRDVARDDTRVELSLDAMAALDGDRVLARRVELEAELKAGPGGGLHDLATALAVRPDLTPPLGSKLAFAIEARRASPAVG